MILKSTVLLFIYNDDWFSLRSTFKYFHEVPRTVVKTLFFLFFFSCFPLFLVLFCFAFLGMLFGGNLE